MHEAPVHPSTAVPWTRLWRTGVLHSCATGISGNYDDEVARFWQLRFASLRDGATLVDVGTGNGAIPLLAHSTAGRRGEHWQVHGVDLADIDPPGVAGEAADQYGDIRFHPNTSMTELPFADGSVDLVCSQFAFEYAPRERAAREILRVIGKDGRAAMVLHSDDSVIHRVSRSQAEACTWLLRESRIFDTARSLLQYLAGAKDAEMRSRLQLDPQAESARAAFNEAAALLMERIEHAPDARVLQTLAQELGRMLQHPWNSPDDADIAAGSLRAWAQDEHARLELMLEAALDPTALQDVARLFGETGLPVRTGKLLYRNAMPMGWTLVIGHE